MRTARQAVAQALPCSKARPVTTCSALLEPTVPLGFADEAWAENAASTLILEGCMCLWFFENTKGLGVLL